MGQLWDSKDTTGSKKQSAGHCLGAMLFGCPFLRHILTSSPCFLKCRAVVTKFTLNVVSIQTEAALELQKIDIPLGISRCNLI